MNAIAEAKALVRQWWAAFDAAPAADLHALAAAHLSPVFRWQGFAPVPDCTGAESFAETFLVPFRNAFPGYTRKVHLFCGGISNGTRDGTGDGALWIGATGYLSGHAVAPFEGIPAGENLRLRWAEFYRIEAGQIVQCQHLIDVVDWLEQRGRSPLPKPMGEPHIWPAPTAYDGDLQGASDPEEGAQSLALCRDLLFGGLNTFDGADLASMGMARFFHPNIKWYGPGGIGACLSLEEFTIRHQEPWLFAFPDRKVMDLDNLFAEDRVVACSSYPGVVASHGGPYQGVGPIGAQLRIHGIDFWLRTDTVFTENWVFVDFPHLFAQMGIDLLSRAKELT